LDACSVFDIFVMLFPWLCQIYKTDAHRESPDLHVDH